MSEAHQYPHVYKLLDDNIINLIGNIDDDPKLVKAQELIYRLKRRQLYTLVEKTNDEQKFSALSEQFDSNCYARCRKVNTGFDFMPKGIILHDDNGDIVDR